MKENNPKVIILKGSVIMLRIGLTTTKRIDKMIPPVKYVGKPPDTSTPCRI